MSKSLVICADDFGLNPAVSQGIAQLAELSRLSATSVMTLASGWPADAALLRPLREQLDVGLHLDWTSPFAIAAGHGCRLAPLMWRTGLRQIDMRLVQNTIERQLDLFETHWQAPPDHVDGHQHIQQFPVIREALMAVLERRYPSEKKPWVRISRPLSISIKARIIGGMGAQALANLARQAGIPHSTHLNGIYDFQGDARTYARHLATWVHEASDQSGMLMMCHPGLANHDARHANDSIAAAREWEYRTLQSPLLPELLEQHGIQLQRGRVSFCSISPEKVNAKKPRNG